MFSSSRIIRRAWFRHQADFVRGSLTFGSRPLVSFEHLKLSSRVQVGHDTKGVEQEHDLKKVDCGVGGNLEPVEQKFSDGDGSYSRSWMNSLVGVAFGLVGVCALMKREWSLPANIAQCSPAGGGYRAQALQLKQKAEEEKKRRLQKRKQDREEALQSFKDKHILHSGQWRDSKDTLIKRTVRIDSAAKFPRNKNTFIIADIEDILKELNKKGGTRSYPENRNMVWINKKFNVIVVHYHTKKNNFDKVVYMEDLYLLVKIDRMNGELIPVHLEAAAVQPLVPHVDGVDGGVYTYLLGEGESVHDVLEARKEEYMVTKANIHPAADVPGHTAPPHYTPDAITPSDNTSPGTGPCFAIPSTSKSFPIDTTSYSRDSRPAADVLSEDESEEEDDDGEDYEDEHEEEEEEGGGNHNKVQPVSTPASSPLRETLVEGGSIPPSSCFCVDEGMELGQVVNVSESHESGNGNPYDEKTQPSKVAVKEKGDDGQKEEEAIDDSVQKQMNEENCRELIITLLPLVEQAYGRLKTLKTEIQQIVERDQHFVKVMKEGVGVGKDAVPEELDAISSYYKIETVFFEAINQKLRTSSAYVSKYQNLMLASSMTHKEAKTCLKMGTHLDKLEELLVDAQHVISKFWSSYKLCLIRENGGMVDGLNDQINAWITNDHDKIGKFETLSHGVLELVKNAKTKFCNNKEKLKKATEFEERIMNFNAQGNQVVDDIGKKINDGVELVNKLKTSIPWNGKINATLDYANELWAAHDVMKSKEGVDEYNRLVSKLTVITNIMQVSADQLEKL